MKKLLYIATGLLSSSGLSIEAMTVIMPGLSKTNAICLLDAVAYNLSKINSSALDLSETDEVFEKVNEQLNLLETIAGAFQRPVEVKLERRVAGLKHKLLDLHTVALRLLDGLTSRLMKKLPNYDEESEAEQDSFVRTLGTSTAILNAANNAPRGLNDYEQELRNVSQARINHIRAFLEL
jgi:hypothetical protein